MFDLPGQGEELAVWHSFVDPNSCLESSLVFCRITSCPRFINLGFLKRERTASSAASLVAFFLKNQKLKDLRITHDSAKNQTRLAEIESTKECCTYQIEHC